VIGDVDCNLYNISRRVPRVPLLVTIRVKDISHFQVKSGEFLRSYECIATKLTSKTSRLLCQLITSTYYIFINTMIRGVSCSADGSALICPHPMQNGSYEIMMKAAL
jgi:hypothetical protein